MTQTVGGAAAINRREALVAEDPLTETYRALDQAGRSVLVRVPRPTEDGFGADRLRHEASLLATLHHLGLVNLVHATDTPPALVTESVEQTLADVDTPWPLKRVTRLVRDLAATLDYLHAHALVHVTLNPASVGLTETGAAKLLNLGLAYRLTHPEDFHWLQADPRFIAPELVRGERPTPLADVYSLGALVYALLAGSGPFDGVEARAVVRAKAFQPPPPLAQRRPDLPSAVYAVIARAMARDPQQRYASAGVFAEALADAASPRRALRPLARSLAVATLLLVTAFAGERALQTTPPRTPAMNPAVAVSLPAPVLSEATSVPAPLTAPPATVEAAQPSLRLPLAPSVAQAAPVEEVESVMAGRGALTWATPEPIEITVGAPLTIIVQAPTLEPTTAPRVRPAQPVVKPPVAVAPVVAPAVAPAPVRAVTNPPVRSAPPARPPVIVPPPIVTPPADPTVVIKTPPRDPAGWAKPVADAPAWKRP